jgi:molybdopterin synthase sulfur carrier subunit
VPHIHLSEGAARRFTGGLSHLDVEATSFRRLVMELDRRFPGLGRQVEEGMAVAVNGEIFQDAYQLALEPDAEIWLIPKIGGG